MLWVCSSCGRVYRIGEHDAAECARYWEYVYRRDSLQDEGESVLWQQEQEQANNSNSHPVPNRFGQ